MNSFNSLQLARAMPNVLHAKLLWTKNGFSAVCVAWRQLIMLEVPYPKLVSRSIVIDDETLTGLKTDQDAQIHAGLGICMPNITDLKHLTHFSTGPSWLTDHSVRYGFLMMEELKHLDLYGADISAESEAALIEKLGVFKRKSIEEYQ